MIRVGSWSFLHLQGYETHFWNTSYLEGSRFSIIQSHLLLDPDRQPKGDDCHICRHPFPQPSPNSFLQDMNNSRACSRILLSFVRFSSTWFQIGLGPCVFRSTPRLDVLFTGSDGAPRKAHGPCAVFAHQWIKPHFHCAVWKFVSSQVHWSIFLQFLQCQIGRNYLEKFPKLLCYSLLPMTDLN